MPREEWKPATTEEAQKLIAQLKAAPIPSASTNFAQSLIGQYEYKGDLSKLQWPYVRKLVQDAGRTITASATTDEPDFDGSKVTALFNKALQHMKFPNMTLVGDDLKAYLSINSRDTKGYIIFQDINDRAHVAHINTKGEGFYRSTVYPDQRIAIIAFCQDPLEYAKMKGIAYKRCCFCGTEITTLSSRYHGYGPICAENYGLPWGDVPAEARAQLQAEIDKELEKDL